MTKNKDSHGYIFLHLLNNITILFQRLLDLQLNAKNMYLLCMYCEYFTE